MMVSLFPKITATTGGQQLPLTEVLAGIAAGRWAAEVEAVRAHEAGSPAYDEAKRSLPYFTPSGSFPQKRAAGQLGQHSGFMSLDLDTKTNPDTDWDFVRAAIEQDEHTYACFVSTGGYGLCVLVPVPTTHHLASFRALEAYYATHFGVRIDQSCKDVSRARFVSYDPRLYLNETAETFAEIVEDAPKPKLPPRAPLAEPVALGPSAEVEDRLLAVGVKMIREAADGDKYHQVRNAGHLIGGYVGSGFVSAARAFDVLYAALLAKENVADPKAAEKALRSGLEVSGPARPLLPDWLQLKVRKELRDSSQSLGAVVEQANKISAASHVPLAGVQAAVQAIADEQRQAPSLLTFWHLLPNSSKRDAPPKLQLSDKKYIDWLGESGFRKYRAGEGNYVTVRVVAGVVHRQDSGQLRDFVNGYLDSLPFEFDGVYRFQVQDQVHGRDSKYFDAKFLQNLPSLEQPFLRDGRDMAYFFFANCWVRISATEREARPYDELPGLIWAEQVRPHHIVLINRAAAEQCDFHTFTYNVSAKDAPRLTVLQNALGYLLHSYKEEMNARCVIFLDEVATTGKPDGRTGKSLLIRAVGELVKVTLIPGATFRFEDSFRFSRVDLDTRILYFDEWDGRRLPFKKLFTEIVSELAVNKKNAPEFVIPFADGPKFAMTTNDVLLGDGSSHEGRKLEIPLAPHYSATHTPKDEFGVGFFREGWDTAEYNRFFNLALFWVQQYLAAGRQLTQLPSATLAARKLEQETGTEFMEFAHDLLAAGVPANEPGIWAADAFARYQTETGDRRTSLQRFNSWLVKMGFEKKKWRAQDHRVNQLYFTLAAPASNLEQ